MAKRKPSGEKGSRAQKARKQDNPLQNSSVSRRVSQIPKLDKNPASIEGDVTPPRNHAGESNKLPKITPSKPRSGHSAAVTNAAISMKTIGEERRNEMVDLYGQHHVHDNDSILKMTQPLDSYQRRIARNIAEKAAKFLEAHLSPNSTHLETTATATPKQRKGKMGAKQTSSIPSSTGIGLRSGVS
ncbi:hypothetical protein GGI17_006718, partial [Coemansia sp. S146]